MRTTLTTLACALTLGATLLTPAEAAAPARTGAGSSGKCGQGELCLWPGTGYGGRRTVHELSATDIESCVPLGGRAGALSLANRTGRPVTTYQSAECGETGEFETYPGGGTWLPESPYRVRAFKIWER
ncbi:peptidase inhibitor family I36 protein [Streptomyces sp. NPDC004959]|uniref:peptidase inhibitor family I36 protein n=1 Tax=unclassified Streptomyces TaxID=2593676 RepID=UPI0004C96508|nr:peptidase inhibitor family I36 protein [Streptomyces sp. NRRL F-5630]